MVNLLELPSFNGDIDFVHPEEFLRDLENQFSYSNNTAEQRLSIALACLKDDAKLWARAFHYKFANYATFCSSFRETYWSIDAQRSLWQLLCTGQYHQKGRKSKMGNYFLRYLRKIQYLEFVPAERDFIQKISFHFPSDVQDKFRQYLITTNEQAYQLLTEEDDQANEKFASFNRTSSKTSNSSVTLGLNHINQTENVIPLSSSHQKPILNKTASKSKKKKSKLAASLIQHASEVIQTNNSKLATIHQHPSSKKCNADCKISKKQQQQDGRFKKSRHKGSATSSINHHLLSSDLLREAVVT